MEGKKALLCQLLSNAQRNPLENDNKYFHHTFKKLKSKKKIYY